MKKSKKRILLGMHGNDGLIFKIILYILLIGISFIFLYPLMQMLVTSFMPLTDLVNPNVVWVPQSFTLSNYAKAWQVLNTWRALLDSILVAGLPTIGVVVSSSLIGYGFANYNFPFKRILMGIMVLIFLIPSVLMGIPTYVMYAKLGIIGSLQAFIYPALTGFGLRQTIFILIFYQFFKQIPNELKEAAEVDGASQFNIFLKIAIPIAMPAFLITALYSFVWYWNETGLANMYFAKGATTAYTTLPMAVQNFKKVYELMFPSGSVGLDGANETFNQGVQFAGTIISISPLLILYFIAQRWFVEGVDRSGITGA